MADSLTWDAEPAFGQLTLRRNCPMHLFLYRMVLTHLRHGAWFEQIEIDFEPRYANCNVHFSALHCWYQSIKQATEKAMRPLAHHPRETTSLLRESGFVDDPTNSWRYQVGSLQQGYSKFPRTAHISGKKTFLRPNGTCYK
ncbi:hypothetical protein EYZ11_006942 [Aspergillus tanneri]|uniref:Uncharacterized protein n=1 Tax=Aspergillus tanneri TaxID=1220188 RepID=A0A4S3JE81_9EURO|nr:hypothetical protein EYZ11_006942 [Aspergillus tanneri]